MFPYPQSRNTTDWMSSSFIEIILPFP